MTDGRKFRFISHDITTEMCTTEHALRYLCAAARDKETILFIYGETCSGKSDFAMKLANMFPACIINADSTQVYKEVDVLTDQPSNSIKSRKSHYLYGFYDVLNKKRFCVADWFYMALEEISYASENDVTPIVVGGTGLYMYVLLHGLLSATKEGVRQLIHKGLKERYKKVVCAWLHPDRRFLYDKINYRTSTILHNGAIEEVENLMKRAYNSNFPLEDIPRIIGLHDIIKHLQNELSYTQLLERMQQKTRNYAKRQVTWFSHKMIPDIIVKV
ncbi:tRNA dimethylallyltransferase [Candidatus Fokinia solitaria]|uniref:tRNA dimethylallyltransferase n=1 Tax=Candidatus Fokinia solitaria TaxID=1802984 RepID=A0A2U8BSE3_9RICK|nr:isopentenyl transferase family protein [Candidatus Fokinia solitaria]AWD33200.1 tRNA dimethylallyltransferase [Candidatus Fokinia solitaria]